MHTKRFALILVYIFTIFLLSGCYDLGDGVENDSEYCSVFNEIILYDSEGNQITDYDMDDFYNPEAVNSFASPISYDDCEKFSYMAIGIAKDISIDDFAIYFNSKDAGNLSVSVFLLSIDELPTKIKTKSNDVSDEECNEPSNDKVIASSSVTLLAKEDDWDSIMISRWKISNDESSKSISAKSGQYLVLRFDNNYYDLETREYDKIKNEFEKVEADYLSAKLNYEEKYAAYNSGSSEVSKEELMELKYKQDLLKLQYEELESKFNTAKANYDEFQSKNLSEMPIRMTAVLIRTVKGA